MRALRATQRPTLRDFLRAATPPMTHQRGKSPQRGGLDRPHRPLQAGKLILIDFTPSLDQLGEVIRSEGRVPASTP